MEPSSFSFSYFVKFYIKVSYDAYFPVKRLMMLSS